MEFNLDRRTAALSVGELSDFALGPHDRGRGQSGLWRAQLGTHWHQELRQRVLAERTDAAFEVVITGQIFHQGWTLTLSGRIDQLLPDPAPEKCNPLGYTSTSGDCHVLRDNLSQGPVPKSVTLREIKTVMRPLPADEAELRREPSRVFCPSSPPISPCGARRSPDTRCRAELLFLEAGSGLAQPVALTLADEALYRAQLDRVVEFLQLRLRRRERLQHLRFRPAFATPRPGQETTLAELTATFERHPAVLFEAPTGFGKTGVLLEFALGQLRSGHFDRVLYLTSKSTGQLQVVRQLQAMTAPDTGHVSPDKLPAPVDAPSRPKCNPLGYSSPTTALDSNGSPPLAPDLAPLGHGSPALSTPVAVWHVRNKAEHCINHIFHCVRDACAYLDGIEARWPPSGLARFYRLENQARDLDTLRAAGREARICPYEITRDRARVQRRVDRRLQLRLLAVQPRTVLRAARVRSRPHAPDRRRGPQPALPRRRCAIRISSSAPTPAGRAGGARSPAGAGAARARVGKLDPQLIAALRARGRPWTTRSRPISPRPWPPSSPISPASRSTTPRSARSSATSSGARSSWPSGSPTTDLRKLLWCARARRTGLTCLDAAPAIGETLREYGGASCSASATLSPVDAFAEAVRPRSSPTPRPTCQRRAPPGATAPTTSRWTRAWTPPFSTARTTTAPPQKPSQALHHAARGPVAVFFPSYAYAEADRAARSRPATGSCASRCNRGSTISRRRPPGSRSRWSWPTRSSSCSAAVLPKASTCSAAASRTRWSSARPCPRSTPCSAPGSPSSRRSAATARFHRVYQIPGMQKVNQALGRLVRAPGQKARVLLHCRRFADITYARLLARDYQFGTNLASDADLHVWLQNGPFP